MTEAVRETAELRRVRDLPRRTPPPIDLVAELTESLSVQGKCPGTMRPNGLCSACDQPMRLHPQQALALHDLCVHRAAVCGLDVGAGKTLISLLAPYVVDAKRPLLLLPASLIEKTRRDRAALSRHWLIPENIRMLSYELLGRAQTAKELDEYQPDLIVGDEIHKLKNRRAACTRRVARYVSAHPETLFVPMTGTLMRKSVREFWHLLIWSLKENVPLPLRWPDLEEWASALDEVPDVELASLRFCAGREIVREPGALLTFCNEEELRHPPRTAARLGFRRRLAETPGVVMSSGADTRVSCPIIISALPYEMRPETEKHFKRLRDLWVTPTGEELMQGVDVWRHAREIALGMCYRWDPQPPKHWLQPRSAWARFVRGVLSRSRTLDSELQVVEAVQAGKIRDGGLLAVWLAVKDTFVPNTVPTWFDDSALKVCAAWMAKAPGVVWSEHAFFAERLAELTGAPYFGAQGLDAKGNFIDDAPSGSSVIASIDANREGRNLQRKWSRCLYTSPPEGADIWQQSLGRFHRTGQEADEVTADVLLGCLEHQRAFDKARAAAKAIRDTTGSDSKLLLADVVWPATIFRGARWGTVRKGK